MRCGVQEVARIGSIYSDRSLKIGGMYISRVVREAKTTVADVESHFRIFTRSPVRRVVIRDILQ